ncbi:LuxR C-terminal-related transcriptional regulator [Nocardioides zeae]|uniref:LuxR C-terminal-related transcriptional regulator n=1 Tax=Nocardioides imazamoxiresistens TaxID=3231893 RepID=A0ABU3PXF8_9ACTN|nr:LuxR C-terminal-related transcriptional regulator [Nocardioides zeae]MDT9593460.1 LuxR C-terminal-related transcriptional regulator [Nocardioides zeae]
MATRRTTQAVLTEFGLTLEVEDLYWRLHGRDGQLVADAASALGYSPETLVATLAPLAELGAVAVDDEGRLRVPSRTLVLARLLEDEVARIEESSRRVRELAATVPYVVAPSPTVPQDEEPLDGFRSLTLSAPTALARWIDESTGDLLIMRPDQWRSPMHPALTAALERAHEAGRICRALYPARALEEAPDVLRARARAGEQIRVLADVPTRLFVIPTTHALVPHMPGYATDRLLAVNERGLVLLLARYFEQLWERALPVPDLDLRGSRERGRRLLLSQLASGAADEQIARTLGVSVRTVRRRISELLIELGADSRFQAGVEAARRGWI